MKMILTAFVMMISTQALASGEVIGWTQQYLKGLSINDSVQEGVSDHRRIILGADKQTGEACSLMIREDSAISKNVGQITYRLATNGHMKTNIFLNHNKNKLIEASQAAEISENEISIANLGEDVSAQLSIKKDIDGLIYEATYTNSIGDKLNCEF